MLKTLREHPSIHNFNFDLKSTPSLSQILKDFDTLKKSERFNEFHGHWQRGISTMAGSVLASHDSETNLLGVLLEIEIDEEKGQEFFDSLTHSNPLDQDSLSWHNTLPGNHTGNGIFDEYTSSKLLSTLIACRNNQSDLETIFNQLKNSKFYHIYDKLWKIKGIDDDSHSSRMTRTQLYGLLIEQKLDPKKALIKFQELKASAFFNKEKQAWICSIDLDQQPDIEMYYTNTQLLGILVEIEFDYKKAETHYEGLKNSLFFNTVTNQWNEAFNPDEEVSPLIKSDIELLDLLIRLKFYKKIEGDSQNNDHLSLPPVRKF